MCGIAGILSPQRVSETSVARMADALAHRGPDDSGTWIDEQAGIGLGHRRLAIVDLSPAGHQPMVSGDGRYVLSFNGEIYNHAELRRELDDMSGPSGEAWRGHSDTETLVECVAAWGPRATLEKCVGMFALSLWDRSERRLFLARDRFGEKPLYYGWSDGDFVFASELKAIRARPGFGNEIDRQALALFAARTYIPAPFSIYRRLYKLEPGCILTLKRDGATEPHDRAPLVGEATGGLSLERYWSYGEVMRAGLTDPVTDEAEALTGLEEALAAALAGQSVADVPVGAFLSGGIDSSTVVALYQKYAPGPVRTFTIGFEESGYDEAGFAREVARALGTEHHEQYVTVKEARDLIPLLPAMYDEPFADSSQIPTHLVSRFARRQVKVALSGDGGDELFGGYYRHFAAPRLWSHLRRLPRPARRFIGPFGRLPPSFWNRASRALGQNRPPHFGAKVQKGLRLAGAAESIDEVYSSFIDEWSLERSPVRDAGASAIGPDLDFASGAPDALRMMYCDAMTYLPDDILCKVDRAAMAVSLETRVPFLDHRVAAFAARLPLSMKVGGGEGKLILRQLLYRELPRRLFDRPKAGFAIPVGKWLRGSLRDWAESLLDPSAMREDGLLDPGIVQHRWQQHLSGARESTAALWAILMFQAWLRENDAAPQPAARAA